MGVAEVSRLVQGPESLRAGSVPPFLGAPPAPLATRVRIPWSLSLSPPACQQAPPLASGLPPLRPPSPAASWPPQDSSRPPGHLGSSPSSSVLFPKPNIPLPADLPRLRPTSSCGSYWHMMCVFRSKTASTSPETFSSLTPFNRDFCPCHSTATVLVKATMNVHVT